MNTTIPIQLDVENLSIPSDLQGLKSNTNRSRPRSNSQSQVMMVPKVNLNLGNKKRIPVQYYVTLLPLNDTFIKKHLPIAIYPETTKLGRPTGTRHKPDVNNGYFDSRVLSRNHAQIFIDSSSGKLMLQDLGSSNGTYLNDQRLGADAVEIKIGDTVCLGFNVQTESTHKQISLKIENITIIKNSDFQLDVPQFKHLSFIEDIYKQIGQKKSLGDLSSSEINDITYDNALFGDINNNIEDDLLGLHCQNNTGIFNNSQITNTSTFESIIHILVANLVKLKQQNNNLQSLETFLINFRNSLNEVNTKYLELELSKHLTSIQADLAKERLSNQKFTDRLKLTEKEQNDKIRQMNIQYEELIQENQQLKLEISRLQQKSAITKKSSSSIASNDRFDNLLDSPQSDESDEIRTNGGYYMANHEGNRNGNDKEVNDNKDNGSKINDSNEIEINGVNNNGKIIGNEIICNDSSDEDIDDQISTKVIDDCENNREIEDDKKPIEVHLGTHDENEESNLELSKQILDIDLNELFHGLSTKDDIKRRELVNMNSSKSSISELEILDVEDNIDENSSKHIIQPFSPTLSTPDETHDDPRLLNGSSNKEFGRELNERLQDNLHQKLLSHQKREQEKNQQLFPTKSDDRFNSNEEIMHRVIIAVGAMLFGYVFKKISG